MKPPKIEVITAFASPLVDTYFEGSEALNHRLRELILQREAQGDKYRNPVPTPTLQVEIFESDFDLFDWPEPEFQTLRNFCLNMLGYVIQQLNNFTPEKMASLRILQHTWFHITRHGGFIAGHNHPMASWSGVYCVDPGDDVPGKPDSGVLRFQDMRPAAFMYMDPANVHLRRPFSTGSIHFKLAPGRLVIFPSYLMHEVGPYFGTRERITIAFNAWVREAAKDTG